MHIAPSAQSLILADQFTQSTPQNREYSQSYQIEDIRLLADMLTLQDELQESYMSALLGGSSLRLPIKTWEVQTIFLNADHGGTFDLALSKNYTRCATLFNFFNQHPDVNNFGQLKNVNSSYFPGGDANENLSYSLHLGSKRMPDNDVRGTSETWYRLLGALGMRDSLAHSTTIDEAAFKSDHFAVGFDLERIPALMASGENLSTGQTIFMRYRGFIGASATDIPRQATVCAHFERIISIMDTVVDVVD